MVTGLSRRSSKNQYLLETLKRLWESGQLGLKRKKTNDSWE
jgi:hypothetical protein